MDAAPFTTPDAWADPIARARTAVQAGEDRAALRALVDGLREGPVADAPVRLAALIEHLQDAPPPTRRQLSELVRSFLTRERVYPALTASGVPGGEGFGPELVDRVSRRVLPPVPDPTDLRDAVRDVFHGADDHLWVEAVPDAEWRRLLDVLGITAESVHGVDEELALSIRVLAHHIASLGLQPEVTARLPHLEEDRSAFLQLGERVLRYLESFDTAVEGDEEPLLDEAFAAVAACRREVELLRANTRTHGTSLWLTSLSYRLLRLLDRLDLLLHLTEPVERDFQGSAVRLFKEIVRAEKTRDHIAPHVRASADLLALEVVEHAARKGSKYITTGRRDYLLFLLSSMGGGLLVALFSLGKVLMGHWQVSLAAEALLFGLNYSLCFVLIYLTGATLATKQPAMTANTLARSLGEDSPDLAGLEDLVIRVWRSQFISFVGNLVVALPVALLLSELFFLGSGSLVAEPAEARDMLADLHPWHSGTLAYAAVAGLLLFAAGLVSGWVDNWIRYRQIPSRVAHQPALVRTVGADRATRFAAALDRDLGAIAGNVFLGFGLGSMGTFGEILGLPLDIRHIAFASAEFGTAVEILRYDVPLGLLAAVSLGVFCIGLINFVVSFGLSLVVALESRRLPTGRSAVLVRHLARRFRDRPLDWFVPPASPRPPSTSGAPGHRRR